MERTKVQQLKDFGAKMVGKFFMEATEDVGTRLAVDFVNKGMAMFAKRRPLLADVVMDMPAEKHEEILEWAQALSEDQVAVLEAMPAPRLKKLLAMERQARTKMLGLRSLSKRGQESVLADMDSEGLIKQLYGWGQKKFGEPAKQENE